jgi:hypothetical protein
LNSKEWVNLFLYLVFGVWIAAIVIFIGCDPYNIWRMSAKNKYFSEKEINTLILAEKLNHKEFSLLFGTSRSNQIFGDGSNIDFLNFSSSLYGNAVNVSAFLKQLNAVQLKNVISIYYLVDDHTLNGYDKEDSFSKVQQLNYDSNLFIEKLKFSVFLNYEKILKTLVSIKYDYLSASYVVNNNGVIVRLNKNETLDVPDEYLSMSTRQYFTNDGIAALLDVDKFCKKNKVPIKYFTPTHFTQYLRLFDFDYMQNKWALLLEGGLSGFYALWNIENISNYVEGNKYIAFKDKFSHLNGYCANKVFIENVVNGDNKYFINSKEKLGDYVLFSNRLFK